MGTLLLAELYKLWISLHTLVRRRRRLKSGGGREGVRAMMDDQGLALSRPAVVGIKKNRVST